MLKTSVVLISLMCICFVNALPHCKVVELPDSLIRRNQINVIYTMRSSCKACTQKAIMLPGFMTALQRIGVDAHFIVAVSNKYDRLIGLVPKITVNRNDVWQVLGEENDHFYILDRCGRMVYEVLDPWSNLQIPFLRGAILATQNSHPCGLCPQDYKMVDEEKLKIYPPVIEENLSPDSEDLPLGIVMKLRHIHHGDSNIYDHIIMGAQGTSAHHRHLPQEIVTKQQPINSLNLNLLEDENRTVKEMSTVSEPISEISVNSKQYNTEKISVDSSINNVRDKNLRIDNQTQFNVRYSEITESSNTSRSEENTEIMPTEKIIEISTDFNSSNEDLSKTDDYESSGEGLDENSPLTNEEIAEKQNLNEHYKKILGWINYDY